MKNEIFLVKIRLMKMAIFWRGEGGAGEFLYE